MVRPLVARLVPFGRPTPNRSAGAHHGGGARFQCDRRATRSRPRRRLASAPLLEWPTCGQHDPAHENSGGGAERRPRPATTPYRKNAPHAREQEADAGQVSARLRLLPRRGHAPRGRRLGFVRHVPDLRGQRELHEAFREAETHEADYLRGRSLMQVDDPAGRSGPPSRFITSRMLCVLRR